MTSAPKTASVHAGDLHQIVREGRRPAEAAKGVRRDRVHRPVGAVQAPPIAERGHDHAFLHVVGDTGKALEVAAVVDTRTGSPSRIERACASFGLSITNCSPCPLI